MTPRRAALSVTSWVGDEASSTAGCEGGVDGGTSVLDVVDGGMGVVNEACWELGFCLSK